MIQGNDPGDEQVDELQTLIAMLAPLNLSTEQLIEYAFTAGKRSVTRD